MSGMSRVGTAEPAEELASADALPAETRKRSFLALANPLSKVLAALFITVALLSTVDVVSAGFVLVTLLAVAPLSGVRWSSVRLLIWPILFAAIVSGWGTFLLAPRTGATLFEIGPLTFTENSLEAGIGIGLRGLALAIPGLLLLFSTDPTDLADALAQWLKLPARFVLGALAAMRLVGLLIEEWGTLTAARRARGVGAHGGLRGRIATSASQTIALLVTSIRRATRLATTMEARGFGAGPRTWARPSTFSWRDAVIAIGGTLIAVLSIILAVALGTFNPIF